jgi:hypothetical protein
MQADSQDSQGVSTRLRGVIVLLSYKYLTKGYLKVLMMYISNTLHIQLQQNTLLRLHKTAACTNYIKTYTVFKTVFSFASLKTRLGLPANLSY